MRAACIQLRSGIDRIKNTADTINLIHAAADAGANYVLTPEMTNVVDRNVKRLSASLPEESDLDEINTFAKVARVRKIWLHIGSLAVNLPTEKLANRGYLFSPEGEIAARYDKIHMFDVTLADGEMWRESAVYEPGQKAVLVEHDKFKVGMAICYDVRFPGLFRQLAAAGANCLTVPAAFTKQTGLAHWHILIRARSIECGAFIFAAAQGGIHEDGRETYGHSLIVSPWGEILAELDNDKPGFIISDIDFDDVLKARKQIPSLMLENSPKLAKLQS